MEYVWYTYGTLKRTFTGAEVSSGHFGTSAEMSWTLRP